MARLLMVHSLRIGRGLGNGASSPTCAPHLKLPHLTPPKTTRQSDSSYMWPVAYLPITRTEADDVT